MIYPYQLQTELPLMIKTSTAAHQHSNTAAPKRFTPADQKNYPTELTTSNPARNQTDRQTDRQTNSSLPAWAIATIFLAMIIISAIIFGIYFLVRKMRAAPNDLIPLFQRSETNNSEIETEFVNLGFQNDESNL